MPSNETTDDLRRARKHINNGDYTKARNILKRHPKDPVAKKWLKQINHLDPPAVPSYRKYTLFFLVLLIVFGIALFVFIWLPMQASFGA